MARSILLSAARSLGRGLILVPAAAGLLLFALWGLAHTDTGRRLIVWGVGQASGDRVVLSGLSGRLPFAPRLERLEIRDAEGPWLLVEDAALDLDPAALLGGLLAVDGLSAGRVVLSRPLAGGGEGGGLGLPLPLEVRQLAIARLDLSGVIPSAPVLEVAGVGSAQGPERFSASLTASAPAGPTSIGWRWTTRTGAGAWTWSWPRIRAGSRWPCSVLPPTASPPSGRPRACA